MNQVKRIVHQGKSILIIDFSHQKAEAALEIMKAARPMIDKARPESLLILTDITEATYDKTVSENLKEFAKTNTPFVKASAVTGLNAMKRIIYSAVVRFSGRNIKAFDTREEALDWLASQ